MTQKPSSQDVRMRGFSRRSRVEEAFAWIDSVATSLPQETVQFDQAPSRVLATEVLSERDIPPFDRSAMDGYALRGSETDGASTYNPLEFKVLGESLPGNPFLGEVTAGTAVRIMTGAPLPAGANAVVPVEYVQETSTGVQITTSLPIGKHVGKLGEDVSTGHTIFQPGRVLRPQDVGLLASLGTATVSAVCQPKVQIVTTGNELVPPGMEIQPYQIFDSNSPMLKALIQRDGAILESHHLVEDDPKLLRSLLKKCTADVILISGGSSVGAEDHAPNLIRELGELNIHGIAMRPSSPAGMGRIGETLVFLLPGNPVSCLCAYDFFAGRALRLLGGRPETWPYRTRQMTVGKKVVSEIGRVDYCRVVFQNDQIEPLASSGASILSSTIRADGFLVVPEELEGYPVGAKVTVYQYDLGI